MAARDATATTTAVTAPAAVEDLSSPALDILREITRGGLAGLIVGVIVGGIGGRLVMRIAALLVPEANGGRTENGNVIGDVTVEGTVTLLLFGGLAMGILGGSLWVMVSPWLPVSAGRRALVAAVLVVAVATPALVSASNPDFIVLRHDPLVVASLVGLVALFGLGLALVDRWLEIRLPRPSGIWAAAYAAITAIGSVITVMVVIPAMLTSRVGVVGYALVVVGLLTLATWIIRLRGRDAADGRLRLVARGALAVAVVGGVWVITNEIRGALLL